MAYTSGSLDAKPDQQGSKRLLAVSSAAQFVSSWDSSSLGHIAFVRDGTLFVQEFDPDNLSIGGSYPSCGGQQPSRWGTTVNQFFTNRSVGLSGKRKGGTA
jgi:hypothetical protein